MKADHTKDNHGNSPFRGLRRDVLYVIKIGGNIIDDETALSSFLSAFVSVQGKKILIHGGGKLATKMADRLGMEQQMIEGRRITDAETLKLVTMVYAGYINKNIVAQLQSKGCNAIGVTGADGNMIRAHKRKHAVIDYGYAGDIDTVNTAFLQNMLENNMAVVAAPITHDARGQLLNTNADTVAQEIAKALSKLYSVSLIYSFEKKGVLMNVDDEDSVIPVITPSYYAELKTSGVIFAGMIPKLDNAFSALENGVNKVIIGEAAKLNELISAKAGTTINR